MTETPWTPMLQPKPQSWHDERRKGIGASDATRIMAGDTYALWQEKTGRADGEDLSRVLPVQLGSFTEPFNLAWFAQETGRAVDVQKDRLWAPSGPYPMHCELDGLIDYGTTIVEAKHVNAFTDMDACLSKYIWQLHHAMIVTGLRRAVLSVIFGNMKWDYTEIDYDPALADQLLDAEAAFWRCVENDTPPPDTAPVTVEIAFDDMREVDMTGSNEWADAAATWAETKADAKRFKDADKALKDLTEADVRLATGHGVQVKRAKNGSLRISEAK